MKYNIFTVNESYLRSMIVRTENILEHSNRSKTFLFKFYYNSVELLILINIITLQLIIYSLAYFIKNKLQTLILRIY